MDWDLFQLGVINKAKSHGIDLTEYVNDKFNAEQMEEVLEGLINNDPVCVYANPKYSWEQMREIRLGLEDEVDVYRYLNPEISADMMKKIRMTLVLDD